MSETKHTATSQYVERDYPAEFEAWWETYRHKNRDLAGYSVKKQIAFDAFYFAARATSPATKAEARSESLPLSKGQEEGNG